LDHINNGLSGSIDSNATKHLNLYEQHETNNNFNSEEKIEFLSEINKRLKKTPSKKELLKKYNEKWKGFDESSNNIKNNVS